MRQKYAAIIKMNNVIFCSEISHFKLVLLTNSNSLHYDSQLFLSTYRGARPPGSKHLFGPSLSWYRSRPRAWRRGDYPNESKIKNITFMMKCANFVGPFDPFRRPAPGRPRGSKHLWRPSLSWYRSRLGASRRGEYPNGSKIKISLL